MPGPDTTIGALIRQMRKDRGWSQARLAEALCVEAEHYTVTRHDISRWESGRRVPGPFWLRHLATVFDAPLTTLETARLKRRQQAVNDITTTQAPLVRRPVAAAAPTAPQRLISVMRRDHSPLNGRFMRDQWIARTATTQEAETLEITPGSPVVRVLHITWTEDGQVLEASESAWPAHDIALVDEYEVEQNACLPAMPSEV